MSQEQEYAIWYKDHMDKYSPEFVGTEKQVIEEWMKYYHERDLTHCITLVEDRDTEYGIDVVDGSFAEEKIRYILCEE